MRKDDAYNKTRVLRHTDGLRGSHLSKSGSGCKRSCLSKFCQLTDSELLSVPFIFSDLTSRAVCVVLLGIKGILHIAI